MLNYPYHCKRCEYSNCLKVLAKVNKVAMENTVKVNLLDYKNIMKQIKSSMILKNNMTFHLRTKTGI